MKIGLISFALLSLHLALFSLPVHPGTEVNNAGGTAEQNVLYAYNNLDRFIGLCLASPLCDLNASQKVKLEKIAKVLPEEIRTPDQIQFKSEKENPGLFMVDGAPRAALTGSTVGSPIFINRDLIYFTGNNREIEAIDIPTAAGILVHEMGHHVPGTDDHVLLDNLGAKVKTLLLQRSHTVYLHSTIDRETSLKATAFTFNDPIYIQRSNLLVESGDDVLIDVTGAIDRTIQEAKICAKYGKLSIPGFKIKSLFWTRYRKPYDSSHHSVMLRGQLLIRCPVYFNGVYSGGTYGFHRFDLEVILARIMRARNDLHPTLPPKVRLVDCKKETCL
jgi:hypothetical protein